MRRATWSTIFGVSLVLGLATGCATSDGTETGDESAGSETPPSGSEDDGAEEGEGASTENALAPAADLTERVDTILETYLDGDDVEEPLGPWETDNRDGSGDDFASAADTFRTNARNAGVVQVEVPVMTVRIGFVESVQQKEYGSEMKKGVLARLAIVGTKNGPALAGLQTASGFSRTTPRDKLPDNGPDFLRLTDGLAEALRDPDRCADLPTASLETLAKHFPEETDLARAVGVTDAAIRDPANHLSELCETTTSGSSIQSIELGFGDFVVTGHDGEGQFRGYVDVSVGLSDDGRVALQPLPPSFERPPSDEK